MNSITDLLDLEDTDITITDIQIHLNIRNCYISIFNRYAHRQRLSKPG